MRKVREVLRLKHELGLSYRAISEATGIGKSAASSYVHRAAVIGITWLVPEAVGDADLERRLFPAPDSDSKRAGIDWPTVQEELKGRGVTLLLLWQEYRTEHPDGYGYSRYCDLYCAWKRQVSATMRQTHPAGEKLFVDWAGDAIGVVDPATGEEHRARIFVAALGASNYTYAEARWSETLPDWIGAHVNALAAIGGVPKAFVPDNLKAGITKPSRYEPGVNRTYQDLADHYGCVVLPTRIIKPRDKAKVEVAVQIVERFVLAKLRKRTFFSLAELNIAIGDCVTAINGKIMRRMGKSRAELLETLERPALKALPAEPYQYAEWKRARVAPDYHIEIADHFYSVPSKLIREVVEARITNTTVEIFHKGQRIASHVFSPVRNPAHDDHRTHAERPPPLRGMDPGEDDGRSRQDRPGNRRPGRGDERRRRGRRPEGTTRARQGPVRQARRRRLDRSAPEPDRHRTDRRRQELDRLRTRPQGLPRRSLGAVPSRVPRLFDALAFARGDSRHARLLNSIARSQVLVQTRRT